MTHGKLAVTAAPFGVGRDTIIKLFLERHLDWVYPPSTVTRAPRPGEVNGKDLNFVDKATFEKWQHEGKFLETDFHIGNWYGTLKEPVESALVAGKNVLLRLDVNGALATKQHYPEALMIFVRAESPKAVEQRVRARGAETEQQIMERIEHNKGQLKSEHLFEHTIINHTNQIDKAVADLEHLLIA